MTPSRRRAAHAGPRDTRDLNLRETMDGSLVTAFEESKSSQHLVVTKEDANGN